MKRLYQKVRSVVMPELKKCRNRDVRVKVDFILLALKLGSVSEACGRRGFSRKFFYKWWNRFKASGFKLHSLVERSRRPKKSPNQIPSKLESKIKTIAKKNYGARMIVALLAREGIKIAISTVLHVLNKRRKASKKTRRQRRKAHNRRYELHIPGQRMQLDVKYVPEFVNGERIYNYVIVDECTRWRFARGYRALNEHMTVDFLDHMLKACPFPIHTIQTDNGFEFTYRLNPQANAKEHLMDVWCKARNIRHRLIPPGEKELNGKVERSHRIDDQYFYWKAPTDNLDHFNNALKAWIGFYNDTRPHGSLGYLTPFEKLAERLESLKTENHAEGIEMLKSRFLREAPLMSNGRDRQLQRSLFKRKKRMLYT